MGKSSSKNSARSVTATAKATDAALAAKGVPSISAVPKADANAPATVERTATVGPAVPGPDRKTFPLSARIVVIAEANPKRAGSKAAAKFPLYAANKDGTVAGLIEAFRAAGYPKRKALSALRWDSGHGFIKIEGETASA